MKMTERDAQFETVLEEALLLHERGSGVDAILERFPEHAGDLREIFDTMSALREAGPTLRPRPALLRRILDAIPSAGMPAARTRPSFGSLWRIYLPIGAVGAIAALLALVRPSGVPAPMPAPLTIEQVVEDTESAFVPANPPREAVPPSAEKRSAAADTTLMAGAGMTAFQASPAEQEGLDPAIAAEDALLAGFESNAAFVEPGSDALADLNNAYDLTTL